MKKRSSLLIMSCVSVFGCAVTGVGASSATVTGVTIKSIADGSYLDGEIEIGYAPKDWDSATVSVDDQILVSWFYAGKTSWQPYIVPDSWHTLRHQFGDVTLEARYTWTSLTDGYAVSYENQKDASFTRVTQYRKGASWTFSSLVATGYSFTGWTPSAITPETSGDLVVTANWKANTYTIKYDANGGKGAMDDMVTSYDADVTIPQNGFERTDYRFIGWTTERGGEVVYQEGATVRNLVSEQNGNIVLYAVWERASPIIISDVELRSIPPWGLVIDYTMSGSETIDPGYSLRVGMTVDGTPYVATSLSGATNCVNGAHRVYWNMAQDGLAVNTTNASVSMAYECVSPRYCVIDLGGATADPYPVVYTNFPPLGGFNSVEYKTTKLVLKRVDAGSFIMGGSQSDESHRVTLTSPFYIGLFEVTQKQWELVMGTNVCSSTTYGKGDAYPVHYVSYDMIRGAGVGAAWPSSGAVDCESFLGKLRKKTGLMFDLPTEAQWEYTCRAGTTTTYSYGNSQNDAYMWTNSNTPRGAREVGTRIPNLWGFYDMEGNVWELCLDWSGDLVYGEDPKGPTSGTKRMIRGGGWDTFAKYCTAINRTVFATLAPSQEGTNHGFRLFLNPYVKVERVSDGASAKTR